MNVRPEFLYVCKQTIYSCIYIYTSCRQSAFATKNGGFSKPGKWWPQGQIFASLFTLRIKEMEDNRAHLIALRPKSWCKSVRKYWYGLIPIDTIFSGMNIHKSQLFWCEQKGYYWFWHTAILVNSMGIRNWCPKSRNTAISHAITKLIVLWLGGW